MASLQKFSDVLPSIRKAAAEEQGARVLLVTYEDQKTGKHGQRLVLETGKGITDFRMGSSKSSRDLSAWERKLGSNYLVSSVEKIDLGKMVYSKPTPAHKIDLAKVTPVKRGEGSGRFEGLMYDEHYKFLQWHKPHEVISMNELLKLPRERQEQLLDTLAKLNEQHFGSPSGKQ